MTLVATSAASTQRIILTEGALAHIALHKQLSWWGREAGGQLFGTMTGDEVIISKASGPYRGDQRSRCSYRSNPRAAQRAINHFAALELIYFGEWHTHPEDRPEASFADLNAMRRLRAASELRMSSSVMLIQGRAVGPEGLALYSGGAEGLLPWRVRSEAS